MTLWTRQAACNTWLDVEQSPCFLNIYYGRGSGAKERKLRQLREICQRPVGRDGYGEPRAACLNKDRLGEQGEGNCRRYRQTCRAAAASPEFSSSASRVMPSVA